MVEETQNILYYLSPTGIVHSMGSNRYYQLGHKYTNITVMIIVLIV